jgi:lipopolysaccharide export system protein LptA
MLCAILLMASGAIALESAREPIVLDHANSLQSYLENGVRWQELQGDVAMTKDSLRVTCQSATFYPDSGLVIFRQNVEFKDPQRILFASQVTYNDVTQQVDADGDVRIYQSDTLSATCRRARYKQRFKQVYLYDDVKLREDGRRILLTGATGFLDHEASYGWVTGNPVLVERDSLFHKLTEIRGDTIFYDDAAKNATCAGNVAVERDSLFARGKRLEYNTQNRYALLVGEPDAQRGEDLIQGDSLKLYFEDEQLTKVEVLGNAVATSPADSGFSEPRHKMEGNMMTLWIDSTAISSAIIEGNAIATYYVRESAKPRGLNVTSGDRLFVYFVERKISAIRVEGGTEGTYTPQRLVGVRVEESGPQDAKKRPDFLRRR